MEQTIEDLEQLAILGYKVQVKMGEGLEFVGEIYHYNHQAGILILKEQNHETNKSNYRLINASMILELSIFDRKHDIQGVLDSIETRTLDIGQVLQREEAVYAALSMKHTVSEHETMIKFFNILQKTFASAEMKEDKIFISDLNVTILPPYTKNNVNGTNSKAVERVQKIVEQTYKKIEAK